MKIIPVWFVSKTQRGINIQRSFVYPYPSVSDLAGGNSDHGPRKTRTKTQTHARLWIYQGKEKLRPWSEFLGRGNSDHGLSLGCFWGRDRRGGSQIWMVFKMASSSNVLERGMWVPVRFGTRLGVSLAAPKAVSKRMGLKMATFENLVRLTTFCAARGFEGRHTGKNNEFAAKNGAQKLVRTVLTFSFQLVSISGFFLSFLSNRCVIPSNKCVENTAIAGKSGKKPETLTN